MDPNGRLFCTFGTYFGNIRMVELDPATGARKEGAKDIDVAIDCEASSMMYQDGWYYLLGTHGTCCDGANSTYNIIVGRSRSPFGPFLDNMGRDMLQGGGKMVVAAEERRFGAGHFGRVVLEPGVEKMSFHWEADLDLSGRSTLAIRPILWKNGWPEAGEILADGKAGILVPVGDVQALADAMHAVLTDVALQERLREGVSNQTMLFQPRENILKLLELLGE
jgi:arabinan endo-1,5-alpha-L-arabinosidase